MKTEGYPSQEELRNIFDYRDDGTLVWKSPCKYKPKLTGQTAGSLGNKGYFLIGLNGRRYLVHRLIWIYFNGSISGPLDHINRNRSDNRIENLRLCTITENGYNSKKRKNTSSKYKGVCWYASRKKWMARIKTGKGHKFLGYFNSEEEAAKVYNGIALEYFGEFAKLNEV